MNLSLGPIALLVAAWLFVGVVVNTLLFVLPRRFSIKRLLTTPWWTHEDFYLRAVFYCAPIWPVMLLGAWLGCGLRRSLDDEEPSESRRGE